MRAKVLEAIECTVTVIDGVRLCPINLWLASPLGWNTLIGSMAPKYHYPPISGGDRKALTKELSKSRAMTHIFAERAAKKRREGEALIREADNLACQSWNEKMRMGVQRSFEAVVNLMPCWMPCWRPSAIPWATANTTFSGKASDLPTNGARVATISRARSISALVIWNGRRMSAICPETRPLSSGDKSPPSNCIARATRPRAMSISASCPMCRRHAFTTSPDDWFVRSARRQESVRQQRCSS
jgi:hypothetical protein